MGTDATTEQDAHTINPRIELLIAEASATAVDRDNPWPQYESFKRRLQSLATDSQEFDAGRRALTDAMGI